MKDVLKIDLLKIAKYDRPTEKDVLCCVLTEQGCIWIVHDFDYAQTLEVFQNDLSYLYECF